MTKLLITKKDIFDIIDIAKTRMSNLKVPTYVSGKEVEQGELVGLAYIESIVMHLNARNLLTELPKVDYTDPSCDHDNELPLEQE